MFMEDIKTMLILLSFSDVVTEIIGRDMPQISASRGAGAAVLRKPGDDQEALHFPSE